MKIPTVAEVERIRTLADPVVRNLQITQCYFELSQAMTGLTGAAANWCTFATWASKQAGQTIRGEDLLRTAEDALRRSTELRMLLDTAGRVAGVAGRAGETDALARALCDALASRGAFRRSSDAVARGNRKVFEEIGREFARFLGEFRDDAGFDAARLERFCAALRAGEPPEGQQLLRDAFTAYGEARFAPDPKERAELLFYGNLLVGLHEQTRLQPEIAEALDAVLHDAAALRQHLLERLLPGIWLRTRYRIAGLFGRRPPLDEVLDRIEAVLRRELRRVVTDALMTLRLSHDLVLRLGRDLEAPFPETLVQLSNPQLLELLARVDPTPDSVLGSGARDWATLADRMHFITDLFRCYHASPSLFQQPFTAEQVTALQAGRRPAGRL